MVDRGTTAVILLTIFASFYGVTFSTYTLVSSLSSVTINLDENGDNVTRPRRDASPKDADHLKPNITLNKCCGQNHILNVSNQCESQEFKTFNPNDIIEKMEFFVVDDKLQPAVINSSRISFSYNYYHPRLLESAIVANWVLKDATVKNNYVFLEEDGSLLELDKARSMVQKKFAPSSYCLDENNYYGSGLIAFINPCVENVCIRKCCPKNWYYNTIQADCVPDSPLEYKPTLYFVTSYSEKDIPYYLLTGRPNCSLTDSELLISSNSSESVYIQEDGFLLFVHPKKKQYYYYDNRSYCVDLFSNGVQDPYVSGFYCEKEVTIIRRADIIDLKIYARKSTPVHIDIKGRHHLPSFAPVHVDEQAQKHDNVVKHINEVTHPKQMIQKTTRTQNTLKIHFVNERNQFVPFMGQTRTSTGELSTRSSNNPFNLNRFKPMDPLPDPPRVRSGQVTVYPEAVVSVFVTFAVILI